MSHRVRALLSARRSCRTVSISACSPSTRSCWSCCCSTTRMLRNPQGSSLSMRINIAPITTGMPSCRASSRARCMPTGRTALSIRSRGLRFDAEKVLVDPYGLVVAVPGTYDRWAAARPGDNVAVAMKSVVADPDRYDWEGDRPLQRPFARDRDLRAACGGLHPPSQLGCRDRQARDLRGTDRKDTIPQGSRRHRGGAAAGVPVRRAGLPAGQDELLGLCTRFVLRATSGVQLAEERRSRPSTNFGTW